MKTSVISKPKTEIAALLLLAMAVLMMGGCASDASRTMTALTQIPRGPHEPITVVAFNSIDPYAQKFQAIESASGGQGSFLPARGVLNSPVSSR